MLSHLGKTNTVLVSKVSEEIAFNPSICAVFVKVATNSNLAKNKSNWIDFNAGEILDGVDVDEKFFDYCIDVANGKETKNEINGYSEISIFKDGVTL